LAQAHGQDRRTRPPREGPALLQGMVMCGICGKRMTVAYETVSGGRCAPIYRCQKDGIQKGEPHCQMIPGSKMDEAVGNIVVESVTPFALEMTLQVQQELQSRLQEAERLRQQQVERAR